MNRLDRFGNWNDEQVNVDEYDYYGPEGEQMGPPETSAGSGVPTYAVTVSEPAGTTAQETPWWLWALGALVVYQMVKK